jgi:hypothetical protein
MQGNAYVKGTTNLHGDLTLDGNIYGTGLNSFLGIQYLGGSGTVVSAPMTFTSTATFTQPVTKSSAASINDRLIYSNTSGSYGIADADIIVAISGSGAGHVWQLSSTGAIDGHTMTLYNYSANTVAIQNDSAGALATLPVANTVSGVTAGFSVVPGMVKFVWTNNGAFHYWSIVDYTKP